MSNVRELSNKVCNIEVLEELSLKVWREMNHLLGQGIQAGEIGEKNHVRASLVAQTVKICLQCGRPGFNSWVGKIPWRRAWQPTPVFLSGKSPWT